MEANDKIFPAEFLSSTTEYHFQQYNAQTNLVYRIVLIAVVLLLISIFFIRVNINVRSIGAIKSSTEHNEIKALVSGRVDSIFLKENDHVTQGQILVKLKADAINQQGISARSQQSELEAQSADLQVLAAMAKKHDWGKKPHLVSSLYSQEYVLLQGKARDAANNLEAATKTEQRYAYLYKVKAISASEYDSVHLAYKNAQSALELIYDDQGSKWQTELTNLNMQMRGLQSEGKSIAQQEDLYTLRAPVTGTVQDLKGLQPGSAVAANDILAEISPETGLIAEVYVLPKDIGLIRPGNKVNFQVDAFNYNQWGLLTGKVLSVSGDVSANTGQQPYFKVRCQLDKNELRLKNGYVGVVKKGMTLQANFYVTRRTLFQLIYDKTNDWLNPGKISKQTGS